MSKTACPRSDGFMHPEAAEAVMRVFLPTMARIGFALGRGAIAGC